MPENNRNNGRNTDGTFGKGNTGKRHGIRHKTAVGIEALLDGEGEALTAFWFRSAGYPDKSGTGKMSAQEGQSVRPAPNTSVVVHHYSAWTGNCSRSARYASGR